MLHVKKRAMNEYIYIYICVALLLESVCVCMICTSKLFTQIFAFCRYHASKYVPLFHVPAHNVSVFCCDSFKYGLLMLLSILFRFFSLSLYLSRLLVFPFAFLYTELAVFALKRVKIGQHLPCWLFTKSKSCVHIPIQVRRGNFFKETKEEGKPTSMCNNERFKFVESNFNNNSKTNHNKIKSHFILISL